MAEKKVGVLIKEARTAAKLSQEKLAEKAGENLTGAMISKCERGEADLTSTQLKKIAIVCGVTQSSLLKAPKNNSEKKTSGAKEAAKPAAAKKTSAKASASQTKSEKASAAKSSSSKTTSLKTTAAAKTGTAKKPAAKTASAKETSSGTSVRVTATEKKLLEAYRGASSDEKKIALKVLRGEFGETVTGLLNTAASPGTEISNVLGDLISGILGGK